MEKTSKTAEIDKKPVKKASPQKIGQLLARSQKLHNAVREAKKALADAEDRLFSADHELRIAMGATSESADKAVIDEVKRIARRENVMVFIWHRSIGPSAIVVTTAKHGKPGFYMAYREQLYDNICGEMELATIELPKNQSPFDVLTAVRKATEIVDDFYEEDAQ